MTVRLIKDLFKNLWYFILPILFPVENIKKENFKINQITFPMLGVQNKKAELTGGSCFGSSAIFA
jgi:hypothetical protein